MSIKDSFQVLREDSVRVVIPEDIMESPNIGLKRVKLHSTVRRSTQKKSTPCRQSALHETNVTPMLGGKDGYMA